MKDIINVRRFSVEKGWYVDKVVVTDFIDGRAAINFLYDKETGFSSSRKVLFYQQPNHFHENMRENYNEFDTAQGFMWFTKPEVRWFLGEVCEDSKEA